MALCVQAWPKLKGHAEPVCQHATHQADCIIGISGATRCLQSLNESALHREVALRNFSLANAFQQNGVLSELSGEARTHLDQLLGKPATGGFLVYNASDAAGPPGAAAS